MKSQDVLVLLKLSLHEERAWKYSQFADELGLSKSQVFTSLERARLAGLVDDEKRRVRKNDFCEFLLHGLRYVFPSHPGALEKGMPILEPAHGHSVRSRSAPPLVWKSSGRETSGHAIVPLCASAPFAARRDPTLYALLSWVEILRVSGHASQMWAQAELQRHFGTASREPAKPASKVEPSRQRDRILEVAETQYAARGFQRASLAAIAEASGVDQKAVLETFGSEDDLRQAVYLRQLSLGGEFVGQAVLHRPEVRPREIARVFREFLALSNRHEVFYRIMLWSKAELQFNFDESSRDAFTFMVEQIGRGCQEAAGGKGESDRVCRGLLWLGFLEQYNILRWSYLRRLNLKMSEQELCDKFSRILQKDLAPILMRKSELGEST